MTTDFWGAVPVAGRGSLPFSLIHGEALVSSAALGLQSAGIDLIDASISWGQIQASGRGVLLHDPLCPLTPPEFLRDIALGTEHGICVAVRPVTDTVKRLDGDEVRETVDRSELVQVCSPIALPATVVGELADWPRGSFEEIVEVLRARWPVQYVQAPPLARRVDSEEAVALLQALSESVAEQQD